MKKEKEYRTEEWNGEDLIDQGIDKDAFQNPIAITEQYTIRFYDKTKKMEVLCDDDWKMLNFYEAGQEIKNQGGLIIWANCGERLGFFKTPASCYTYVEDMINCFNEREDFEKSAYMFKELTALKKHMNENKGQYPEL